jgi:hypothetical protein
MRNATGPQRRSLARVAIIRAMSDEPNVSPEVPVESPGSAPRPQWRRPEVQVLDVEKGTLTTTGPVADINGSTS